ncbi:MAG: 2-hydroxyhepta-2,4-diene-1,7-dioate isomerase, partial [Alphaproteobacteria bacterium]|nr:2-hydroxyhepta-2,4-diene-1,7-dioate isomerase [Alphaproteobacteria bacterium]
MKLLRYGPPGAEKPGLLGPDGAIRDLSTIVRDIDGETVSPESLTRLAAENPASLPRVGGNPRIGACVARPLNYVCIGLNYADHAAEAGQPIPR